MKQCLHLLRTFTTAFVLLALSVVPAAVQDASALYLTGPRNGDLSEGKTYDITWASQGVSTVTVVASGRHTSTPVNDRGKFEIVIADGVPAEARSVSWTVPALDTLHFRITLKGYNYAGQLIASQEEIYTFRPAVLRTKTVDGIYIDVRDPIRQRMYVLKGNRVIRAYLTSGANTNEFYPRNVHPKKPHDHPGVFRVVAKYPNWYSRAFQVDMPWSMRYLNGHFIHATIPKNYWSLGAAASSGCNRLHYDDAKDLYDMTPVGTRVEIIAG